MLSFLAGVLIAQSIDTVDEIDKWVKQQDAYAKRSLPRVYGDAASYDAKKPQWRRYSSVKALEKARVENLYEVALVYPREPASPLRVDFSLSSPSGDWAQYNTYYFRPDGPLAKLDSTHNTFYGNVRIHRILWFGREGTILKKVLAYRELGTEKRIDKPTTDYFNRQPPVYRAPANLPFAHLLSSSSTPQPPPHFRGTNHPGKQGGGAITGTCRGTGRRCLR